MCTKWDKCNRGSFVGRLRKFDVFETFSARAASRVGDSVYSREASIGRESGKSFFSVLTLAVHK